MLPSPVTLAMLTASLRGRRFGRLMSQGRAYAQLRPVRPRIRSMTYNVTCPFLGRAWLGRFQGPWELPLPRAQLVPGAYTPADVPCARSYASMMPAITSSS